MHEIIKKIFRLSILFVLIISFYFLVDIIIFKNKENTNVFSTWQFPMLLAIYLDLCYYK